MNPTVVFVELKVRVGGGGCVWDEDKVKVEAGLSGWWWGALIVVRRVEVTDEGGTSSVRCTF